MRNVYVFAGQGTQYYNMGKPLLSSSPIFADWMEKAEGLMLKRLGISLLHSLYTDLRSPLDHFALSHPALFAVQFAAAKSLKEPIDFVIGASLGEFVAMTIAGAFSFEDAFCHILDQVELFQKTFPRGKMIAVLESKDRIVDSLVGENYEIAAASGPQHYTLSTPGESYSRLKKRLIATGCLHLELPVDFPFHSQWVDSGKASFLEIVEKLNPMPLNIPFASCTTLSMIQEISPNHLWDALRNPIKTEGTFQLFLNEDDRVIDCSPSGTMKGIIRSLFGNTSPLFKETKTLMSPYQMGKT